MLALVINLNRSNDRLKRISARLNELNVNFERVEAFDGFTLSDDEYNRLTYPYNHPCRVRFTRELTKGEVGCFISHRKCWEKLVESNENYAVILEDDLYISDEAKQFLTNLDWIPEEIGLIRLSSFYSTNNSLYIKDKSVLNSHNEYSIAKTLRYAIGTQCYIISKEFAKNAIEMSVKFECPVDEFLFNRLFEFANTCESWQLIPSVICQNEQEDSFIGKRLNCTRKANFLTRHGLKRTWLMHILKSLARKGELIHFDCRK